jgi:hypothetical protein
MLAHSFPKLLKIKTLIFLNLISFHRSDEHKTRITLLSLILNQIFETPVPSLRSFKETFSESVTRKMFHRKVYMNINAIAVAFSVSLSMTFNDILFLLLSINMLHS